MDSVRSEFALSSCRAISSRTPLGKQIRFAPLLWFAAPAVIGSIPLSMSSHGRLGEQRKFISARPASGSVLSTGDAHRAGMLDQIRRHRSAIASQKVLIANCQVGPLEVRGISAKD
jgi:hypothetical protein